MENAITAVEPTEAISESGPDSDNRLIDLWLHGRPQTTQRSYRAAADRLTAHVGKPLHQMTLGELQGFADSLDAAALQPATRRRLLAATKSLFSFGHGLGYLPFDTAKPLRLPPLRDTLTERVVDESSLLRMIALEPNPRNAAMIALMYGAALRVSEAVALRWRDCHARSNGEGQCSVFGKGGKTRAVLLPASVSHPSKLFAQTRQMRATSSPAERDEGGSTPATSCGSRSEPLDEQASSIPSATTTCGTRTRPTAWSEGHPFRSSRRRSGTRASQRRDAISMPARMTALVGTCRSELRGSQARSPSCLHETNTNSRVRRNRRLPASDGLPVGRQEIRSSMRPSDV